MKSIIRLLLILVTAAVVIVEAYYISVLNDKISKQKEELRHISMQLQFLRNEKDSLNEKLSLFKKSDGENKDGNTANR